MRLLVLSNLLPPEAEGGLELSCFEACLGLHRRGHDVQVVTQRRRGDTAVADPFPVHRILEFSFPASHYGRDPRALPRLARDTIVGARVARRNEDLVARLAQRERVDVVAVWGFSGIGAGVALPFVARGVPVVWCVGDYYLRDVLRPPLARRLAGTLLAPRWQRIEAGLRPQRILVNSEFTRRGYLARGIDPAVLHVVHRGIASGVIDAPAEPRDVPPTVFMPSRITPRKGVDVAVRALAALRRRAPDLAVRLDVAGTGEPQHVRALEELVTTLGLGGHVRLLGLLDHAEILSRMRRASAVVGASLVEEYFGRVNVEAMACRVPLIVSATDNVREIGDDEVHLLAYPPGDAAALAERLQRVLTDPALADRLVRAAHQHVGECFRQESIVERIERHLQEAIAAAPPSSR